MLYRIHLKSLDVTKGARRSARCRATDGFNHYFLLLKLNFKYIIQYIISPIWYKSRGNYNKLYKFPYSVSKIRWKVGNAVSQHYVIHFIYYVERIDRKVAFFSLYNITLPSWYNCNRVHSTWWSCIQISLFSLNSLDKIWHQFNHIFFYHGRKTGNWFLNF